MQERLVHLPRSTQINGSCYIRSEAGIDAVMQCDASCYRIIGVHDRRLLLLVFGLNELIQPHNPLGHRLFREEKLHVSVELAGGDGMDDATPS